MPAVLLKGGMLAPRQDEHDLEDQADRSEALDAILHSLSALSVCTLCLHSLSALSVCTVASQEWLKFF
jgi:hypothetical protein